MVAQAEPVGPQNSGCHGRGGLPEVIRTDWLFQDEVRAKPVGSRYSGLLRERWHSWDSSVRPAFSFPRIVRAKPVCPNDPGCHGRGGVPGEFRSDRLFFRAGDRVKISSLFVGSDLSDSLCFLGDPGTIPFRTIRSGGFVRGQSLAPSPRSHRRFSCKLCEHWDWGDHSPGKLI